MSRADVYCILNAPRQHGDLWVKVTGDTVEIMNPAGAWWRGRTFTVAEFCQVFKDAKK